MATVRFSEELKSYIRGNARNIYEEKLSRYENNFIATSNLGEEIYNLVLGKSLDVQPDWCFDTISHIEITDFYNIPDSLSDSDKGLLNHYGLRYEFSTAHAVPYGGTRDTFKQAKGCTLSSYGRVSMDYTDSRWDSIKSQLMAHKQGEKAIKHERDEFVDGVMAVVNAHATLAPAVKAWSGLWELVPEEYQERAKRVVSKKERQVVTREGADVDLNKMTGVVVASKLTK